MSARLALPQKLRSLGIIGRGRWGRAVSVAYIQSNVENFTSIAMSALPPKADIAERREHVR